MNGAELACGSIISVEPANSDYKSNLNGPSADESEFASSGYYGPTVAAAGAGAVAYSSATSTAPEAAGFMNETGGKDGDVEEEGASDDLDDFFAGL